MVNEDVDKRFLIEPSREPGGALPGSRSSTARAWWGDQWFEMGGCSSRDFLQGGLDMLAGDGLSLSEGDARQYIVKLSSPQYEVSNYVWSGGRHARLPVY